MKKQIILIVYLILTISKLINAQIRSELDTVELDLGLNITKSAVPFDKPFIIKGVLPTESNRVYIVYKKDTFNGIIDAKDSKTFEILFNYPLPYKKKDDTYIFNLNYEEKIKPEQLKPIKEQLNRILFNYIQEKSKENGGIVDANITRDFQQKIRNLIKISLTIDDANFRVRRNSFLDENSSNVQNIFDLGEFVKDFKNLNDPNNDIIKTKKQVDEIIEKYIQNLTTYSKKNNTLLDLKKVRQQLIIDIISRGCSDIIARSNNNCDEIEFGKPLSSKELTDKVNLINKNIDTINSTDLPFTDESMGILNDYTDKLSKKLKTQEKIEKEVSSIVDFLEIIISQSIIINTSLTSSMTTRASWYSSADVGILYAYQQKEFVPFIGLNVYFRPIDKNIPFERLRAAKKQRGENGSLFWYRFSAVVGLTFGGLTKNDDPKFNIIFGRGIITGVGYRLYESLKLNAGVLWFNQKDINPLVNQYTLKPTPYISLSLDWNLSSLVSGFFK